MKYLTLFEKLQHADIKYLLVGGIAINLYGVPRATADVDIVVPDDAGSIKHICELLFSIGFNLSQPIDPKDLFDWEKLLLICNEKNLISLNFYHPKNDFPNIDVLIVYPFNFNDAYNHKVIKTVGETEIFLASIDDIIFMKSVSRREQDKADVEMLKKVQNILTTKD
jgi:hypothetical protein